MATNMLISLVCCWGVATADVGKESVLLQIRENTGGVAKDVGVKLGVATGQPVAKCELISGFLTAKAGGSCFLAKEDGTDVVVDYTKQKYTKYMFDVKMESKGGTVMNGNVNPHGGFKMCNVDKNIDTRGSSPELWFIDRNSDFGYGLYNGGWDSRTYTNKNIYGDAMPSKGKVIPWEVTMMWVASTSKYTMVEWKTGSKTWDTYAGKTNNCKGTPSNRMFVPRMWAYNAGDFFGIQNLLVYQGDDLANLKLVVGTAAPRGGNISFPLKLTVAGQFTGEPAKWEIGAPN